MKQTSTNPRRFLSRRFRSWKNETRHGRQIAKLCARYRRRSKQYLVRALKLDAVMPGGSQSLVPVIAAASTVETAPRVDTGGSELSTRLLATIRHFANPGPEFEEPSTLDSRELSSKVRAVAFYLPQFHAFPENDRWWGEGFSEWRNVARGAPRFEGHYQPRIPRDLGFYDLKSRETLRAQSELATRFGIEAFCFYYYWFNGKRLMDMPLDNFADDEKITQQFCIMWANENWTRTWDGHDNEVLIQQDYLESDEQAFIADTVRYMANPRYLRVDGRPLFILYRPGLLPDARSTLARWKEQWEAALGVLPWVLMVQGFDCHNPAEFGLDGAVEFPPHKVAVNVPDINDRFLRFDQNFSGHVRSYEEVVAQSLGEDTPSFPLIKTVSPHWDNDARREGRGMVLHGSTPALYERWLNGAIEHATRNPLGEESLVFVNAWNEWAEAAYLEPDVHYGHAYLNATQRAVHGLSSLGQVGVPDVAEACQSGMNRLLLVGHDGNRNGAQMLLLSLARIYREQFGMQVTVLLREGGPMLEQYRQVTETLVLSEMQEGELAELIQSRGLSMAICNTCVSGDVLPALKECGLTVVSLIHEMPRLIEEFSLQGSVRLIDTLADHVVFPSPIVQRGFASHSRVHKGEQHIMPQGTYKRIVHDQAARERIRAKLGLNEGDKLVLNVGYADLRKGFDLFIHTAQQWMMRNDDVHFVWVGAVSADMKRWLESDLSVEAFSSRIHLEGFATNMSDYYSACDTLFLTSREDPYPTVVLEAMNVGVPVVLFREATGFDSVMQEHGYLVSRGDVRSVNTALSDALYNDSSEARAARVRYVEEHCQLDDYCFRLLQLLQPALPKTSVVLPNYNYESYMPERLSSIFAQDMPVFEIIVLDDCSTDNSLKMIESCALAARRRIRVVANDTNSGNVFRQWKHGLSLCRGDRVWIAEADDSAAPDFLSASMAAFKSHTAFSFTDSKQIDEKGRHLADDYHYYYSSVAEDLFSGDFVLDGREFIREALSVKNVILNVSAVVWHRERLECVLRELADELTGYSLVGDWRLYLACLDAPEMSVAYIDRPLNVHRRHSSSVTHSLDYQHHLNEILDMHACARKVLQSCAAGPSVSTGRSLDKRQADYEEQLRRQFRLPMVTKKAA